MSPQTPTLESPDPQAAPGASSGAALTGDGVSREAYNALQRYKQPDFDTPTKVVVRFKATGSAPVLKLQYYKISASNRFQTVISFLRNQLGCKPSDSLFLYINAAFSPSPDDLVSSLYKNFATEKQLIVNYSVTAAWG